MRGRAWAYAGAMPLRGYLRARKSYCGASSGNAGSTPDPGSTEQPGHQAGPRTPGRPQNTRRAPGHQAGPRTASRPQDTRQAPGHQAAKGVDAGGSPVVPESQNCNFVSTVPFSWVFHLFFLDHNNK